MKPGDIDESDTSEADDIRAAQRGDHTAFARLIRRHQARLRGLVARYVIDVDDVHDIVQDALLVTWRRIDDIEPNRGVGPWLRTTCRNLTMSYLRKKSRRQEVVGIGRVEAALAERLQKEPEQVPEQDRLTALRRCLEQLSGEHRDLLKRRYRDGEAVKDIGAEQAKSPTAVTMVFRRLRERLYECINRRLEMQA